MHPDFRSSWRFHLGPGPTCLRFASLQTGRDADDSPGETSVGPASASSRPPSSRTQRTSAHYPIRIRPRLQSVSLTVDAKASLHRTKLGLVRKKKKKKGKRRQAELSTSGSLPEPTEDHLRRFLLTLCSSSLYF